MIPEAATSILALFAGMTQLHGKKLARIDGILHLQIQDLKKRPTYPLGLLGSYVHSIYILYPGGSRERIMLTYNHKCIF